MKVCHITPAYFPAFYYGGPTYSVHGLCRHLAGLGCEVRVLTTNANGPREDLSEDTGRELVLEPNLRVRYCRQTVREVLSLQMLALMASYIRWADVVHVTAVYSFSTIPALALARLLGKPVVWSPRGSLQRWEGTRRRGWKAAWEAMCRLMAPRQVVLHATSEEESRQSRERMKGAQAVVVPNGVEIPVLRAPQTGRSLTLLFLGRLQPIKGLENLLEACGRLHAAGELDCRLVIAGTGPAEYRQRLEREAERLGLVSFVEFAGPVEGEGKERCLVAADVLVVPSHSENFGMVVLEALAHGRPVIASRATPWARLEEKGCGLWVANDPDSLAAAIRKVKRSDRWRMGLAGRLWVAQEFAWPHVARRMAAVYSQLSRPGRLR